MTGPDQQSGNVRLVADHVTNMKSATLLSSKSWNLFLRKPGNREQKYGTYNIVYVGKQDSKVEGHQPITE